MEDLQEFERYMAHLSEGLGHSDRHAGLRGYTTGLMSPLQRKSVEPMAAHMDPLNVRSRHQSLHHFVADANWSDERMLLGICQWVVPLMDFSDGGWWIIDDTGFPKHGPHSVGVSHQYCGELGKQANCQIAVSLSVANQHASLPVAYRLYLPESWAKDKKRRKKAGIPDEIEFQTKPKIALQQIEWACEAGIPRGVVLMDCAYGSDLSLRTRMTALGLAYSVGIWARTLVRKAPADAEPMTAIDLARSLPKRGWRTVGWRVGTNAPLVSRFARVRVRAAGEGTTKAQPEEWLIIEWPKDEKEPTKFWLSTLPEKIDFTRMIDVTMMRWRIERDYQELKQEVGLGHFEGRGWRGFHHHATMCIAAYGFLVSERSAFPPSGPRRFIQEPAIPQGYRPRGSPAPARAPRPQLDRNRASAPQRRPRRHLVALSVLCKTDQHEPPTPELVTQYD